MAEFEHRRVENRTTVHFWQSYIKDKEGKQEIIFGNISIQDDVKLHWTKWDVEFERNYTKKKETEDKRSKETQCVSYSDLEIVFPLKKACVKKGDHSSL